MDGTVPVDFNSLGMALAFSIPAPIHRKIPLRPAEPISEHIKSCISFLQRVTSVQITGGDKKAFAITVQLKPSVVNPNSKAATYTITRTNEEIAALQLTVTDGCRQHARTDDQGMTTPCALCEPLKTLPLLPLDTADRLMKSKDTIQQIFEERLVTLVERVVVAPSNAKFHCEGIVVAPAAVAAFLLRGVDQSQL